MKVDSKIQKICKNCRKIFECLDEDQRIFCSEKCKFEYEQHNTGCVVSLKNARCRRCGSTKELYVCSKNSCY